MTPKNKIRQWFEEGASAEDNTHMLVVCDMFDWDDFPVYVKTKESCEEVFKRYNYKTMKKVMEIYDLREDMESQLRQERAWALK